MNEENNNHPDLTQQLNECLNQKEEWKDRCLRTAADFENYKKRSEKERSVWVTSAQSSILTDLLSIVDDFDRASSLRLSGSSDSASFGGQVGQAKEDQSMVGFAMIHKEFQKFLEKQGVTEIKETQQFDPHLHEAIMNVESADHESGTIVQVLQKGYLFKGQVLRPAKVSVAK